MTEDKIAHAAELIRNGTRVVALTGAGISTPSGIPDFRSPGSGMWERVDPFQVASIDGFMRDPQAFYDWLKPLVHLAANAKPNAAHFALAELEARGKLQTVITQNIDQLHQRAGSRRVLLVHGTLDSATCIVCGNEAAGAPLIEKFLTDGIAPRCVVCGGVLKPDVVLFGELLPFEIMEKAKHASQNCDVMICAGSSLEVAPACDLPLIAKRCGAKIIIVNKTATAMDRHATIILNEDVAVALPRLVELVTP
ncbi:MAG: NAD-dependent deacylase [Chloroflexi bacterium]|nr:NAD-dependent deacylase [Chloroflexota bacterium]